MAKLVLISLADRANDHGQCWPAISTIADDCHCSRRTVERALTYLEEKGFIRRQTRASEGMKETNIYHMTLDASQSRIDASQSRKGSVTESHKTPIETPKIKDNDQIARFEQFWTRYPRKVGKPKARAVFDKLVTTDDLLDAILWNIDQRLEQGEWDAARGVKYIPHPTTWLNREGWNDQITPRATDSKTDQIAARNAAMLARLQTDDSDGQRWIEQS